MEGGNELKYILIEKLAFEMKLLSSGKCYVGKFRNDICYP